MNEHVNIIVRLTIEGLHSWFTCDIEEVAYLKNKHRHMFYIECKKKVFHNDRQIEIISFKHAIKKYLLDAYSKDGLVCDFGGCSCESIACELMSRFSLCYCKVLEDNENGAECTI